MIYVTGMVDEAVWPKIDTRYIMSKFADIDRNVVIVFICSDGDVRKDDTWKHKGKTFYSINLPYEEVLALDDARPLLLEAVAKRLGVPLPPIEEAAAA